MAMPGYLAQFAIIMIRRLNRPAFPNVVNELYQNPSGVFGHFPYDPLKFSGHTDQILLNHRVTPFILLVKCFFANFLQNPAYNTGLTRHFASMKGENFYDFLALFSGAARTHR
jgi:hypothetical protein